jgi:16S rRNA (cytosine967-C5)-methyltransferase
VDVVERSDLARDAILSRLLRIENGQFARDHKFPSALNQVERRRATEYIGGITRNRRWLDFVIDHWAKTASMIQPVVRQVLRIGTYELIILDRPPHAVVNASVEQAKRRMKGRRSSGFVNAILRQIERNRDAIPIPDSGSKINDLAIQYSHPTWMVERWMARFGRVGTIHLLEWNNSRPSFGLRINRLVTDTQKFGSKLDSLDIDWSPSEYLEDYVVVQSLQQLVTSELIDNGEFAVQDESAGLVVDILDPQPGEFIVDACAAPGGKTIRAAMLMQNEGRVLAVDPNNKRLSMAADAASRHGLSNIEFQPGSFLDLEVTPSRRPDRILLDVPCSGLGVLARRPDLRWRQELQNLDQLTRLQDQLLDKAALLLKPGGTLTYATCTIAPEENHMRVKAFLKRHKEFHAVPVTGFVTDSVVDQGGYLATLPNVHHIDGAFAARMTKVK